MDSLQGLQIHEWFRYGKYTYVGGGIVRIYRRFNSFSSRYRHASLSAT